MPFHRRRGIDRRQCRGTFHHESIGFTTMIEIMTKTSNEQSDTLNPTRERSPYEVLRTDRFYLIGSELMFGLFDHRVDRMSNTEGV